MDTSLIVSLAIVAVIVIVLFKTAVVVPQRADDGAEDHCALQGTEGA